MSLSPTVFFHLPSELLWPHGKSDQHQTLSGNLIEWMRNSNNKWVGNFYINVAMILYFFMCTSAPQIISKTLHVLPCIIIVHYMHSKSPVAWKQMWWHLREIANTSSLIRSHDYVPRFARSSGSEWEATVFAGYTCAYYMYMLYIKSRLVKTYFKVFNKDSTNFNIT